MVFQLQTIDAKYITPTLLSSMAESGWLTRSLEQPYPYTLDYKGEISGKGMKESFLRIIDVFQKNHIIAENMLRLILNKAILFKKNNLVKIKRIDNVENLTISIIIKILEEHFIEKYDIHGGSKLPVLALYAIYKSLILEINRYENCKIISLGSHTASDRTSKNAGDIQIMNNNQIFEVVEVKSDRSIDMNMVRIVYEKIIRFNPKRYYLFSNIEIRKR